MAATPEPDPEDQTGEQAGHKADDAVERQGRTNVTNLTKKRTGALVGKLATATDHSPAVSGTSVPRQSEASAGSRTKLTRIASPAGDRAVTSNG